jgi:predicted nucleotidyltransferase
MPCASGKRENENWLASCSQNDWLEVINADPNVAIVEIIASHLGELCSDVVFVGGCAASLLLTQMRSDSIRVTRDVDVIASVTTLGDYHKLENQLRAKGFQNDISPNAPICRWLHSAKGGLPVLLDLMPSDPTVLGFANCWYQHAIETSQMLELPSGRVIRLIAAPAFIATKLEAVKSRGSSAEGVPDFETTLAGHLPPDMASQARLSTLRQKLRDMAQLNHT